MKEQFLTILAAGAISIAVNQDTPVTKSNFEVLEINKAAVIPKKQEHPEPIVIFIKR